mmetsp:Transcript_63459/g.151361  ORF Transcript_63459/g.151361 Transcript_63459/m.151361 type:complete len:137 (+) Transcript_63459:355-765(+)
MCVLVIFFTASISFASVFAFDKKPMILTQALSGALPASAASLIAATSAFPVDASAAPEASLPAAPFCRRLAAFALAVFAAGFLCFEDLTLGPLFTDGFGTTVLLAYLPMARAFYNVTQSLLARTQDVSGLGAPARE